MDIKITETAESQESRAETNDSAFDILLGDEPALFLYVNRRTYVLAWNGALDFDLLHFAMLDDLPAQIGGNEERNFWRLTATFQVSGLSVTSTPFRSRYLTVFPNPSTVAFARYDVVKDGEFVYAATAANPEFGDNEIAIERPRGTAVDERMFRWILNHHQDRSLSERVDTVQAILAIGRAIGDGYPEQE